MDHQTTPLIDVMLARLAKETIEDQRLKASFEKNDDDAPALLTVSFDGEQLNGYYDLSLHARLGLRFTDGDPITVWTLSKDIGKMSRQVVLKKDRVSPVLRKNVEDFYEDFGRELRRLISGS